MAAVAGGMPQGKRARWWSWAVAWACALLAAPTAALAQTPAYWTTNCNTSGCHANPTKISTGPLDTRTDTRVNPPAGVPFAITAVGTAVDDPANGLSDWLATATAFRDHLNARRNNAGAMATLADSSPAELADAASAINVIRQYLTRVRDAVVPGAAIDISGNTSIGSTVTRTLTIENYRFLPLGFTVSNSNPNDFDVIGCGVDTAGGDATGAVSGVANNSSTQQSCSLTIRFHPTTGAALDRSTTIGIAFSGNEGGDPPARNVSVTGHVPPGVLQYTSLVSQLSRRINTGGVDVKVGSLSNSGDASFNLTGIALVSGPSGAAASYAVASTAPGSCTTTQLLTKNASCDLWVHFDPTAQGGSAATFRATRSGVGVSRDIPLTGTGTQPLISPTSASIDFANVQVGVPSTPRTVTLSSVGNMALTFNSPDATSTAALSGPNKGDFVVGASCATAPGSTLANGADCTLSVTFTPPVTAPVNVARSATLTVATDANNNGGVLVVGLTGMPVALPDPRVQSPATDFPDTVIGEDAAQTRLITIVNDRTRAVTYTLTDAADFKFVSQACPVASPQGTVPGSTTCTVTMRFHPLLAGGETRRTANIPLAFSGTGGDAPPGTLTAALAGRALLPLQLSGGTLNLNAEVGTPTTSLLVLTNRAATALTLNTLPITGANPGDFAVDATGTNCAPGRVLGTGANCPLVVRFDPPQAGTRSGTLTINHSALGNPQTVALNGTATPRPQGRLELSATALNFVDTQLNSSSTLSLTLNNAGNLALNFSAFDLTGTAGADFTRGGTCSTATPLPSNTTCTVTITFAPSALGARSAALTIVSDGSNATPTVGLAGNGVPIPVPKVTLTPAALNFGAQTFGGVYPPRLVRLDNTGTATLDIASIGVEGSTFADATRNACPATLAAGAGCDLQIRFTPAAAGASFNGLLRVTSNAAGSPHTVALSGSGTAEAVPVLAWSPAVTQLAFIPPVSAGTVSEPLSATLVNQGPGGVRLKLLNTVGPDAAAFSVGGGTCVVDLTLFEGESCTVSVRFVPSVAGERTAAVQVASTGSFPPTLTLLGTGMGGPEPGLRLSVGTISFDGTRLGSQSLPTELTLSSIGSGAVRVDSLQVDGPFTVQGKTCPNPPFSLPTGGECTLSVSFAPQAEGDANGMLRVSSNAAGASREVALSGRGEAKADLSSGGCSMIDGESATDPTLWTLVLLAAIALLARRRARAARRDRP